MTRLVCVAWSLLFCGLLVAAEPAIERSRLEGYVGGPYKLLVRDFRRTRKELIAYRI